MFNSAYAFARRASRRKPQHPRSPLRRLPRQLPQAPLAQVEKQRRATGERQREAAEQHQPQPPQAQAAALHHDPNQHGAGADRQVAAERLGGGIHIRQGDELADVEAAAGIGPHVVEVGQPGQHRPGHRQRQVEPLQPMGSRARRARWQSGDGQSLVARGAYGAWGGVGVGACRWGAGGGGVSHGATDELGVRAVESVHPLYDFNATILHLLGMDHERLTYEHNGIQRRLTNVEGSVIREVMS